MKNTFKALLVSLGLISASLLQASDALEILSIEGEKAYLDVNKICDEIIKELTEQIELTEQTEDDTANPYKIESFCSDRMLFGELLKEEGVDIYSIRIIPTECPESRKPSVDVNEILTLSEYEHIVLTLFRHYGLNV